jgi:hypothetical protein
MPFVFCSGKLKFFFYSNEGDPREPVHIHVRSGGANAKIWLEPTIGVASTGMISTKTSPSPALWKGAATGR